MFQISSVFHVSPVMKGTPVMKISCYILVSSTLVENSGGNSTIGDRQSLFESWTVHSMPKREYVSRDLAMSHRLKA